MSDKSPRQSASKKSNMSIKEKRAVKKSKKAGHSDGTVAFLRDKPGTGRD